MKLMVAGVLFLVLTCGVVPFAIRFEVAKASDIIYVDSDFVFTADIYQQLVVIADNITIDGNGFSLRAPSDAPSVSYGIELMDRNNVVIKNVFFSGWSYAIFLHGESNGNTITNNTIDGGNSGILLYQTSSWNTISDNIISNVGWGIILQGGGTSGPNDNTMVNNHIQGSPGCDFLLNGANRNVMSNNTLVGNSFGFKLEWGSDNVISYNLLIGQVCGLLLEGSVANTISRNTFEGMSGQYGVALSSSSSSNLIFENTLSGYDTGLYIYSSTDSMVYHNNILNNTQNIFCDGSTNTWNKDYPHGGNYWSDYVGTDVLSGRFQNETGSDGIGDTPYGIDGSNFDDFPLMSPWIPPNVSALNMTISKTIVGQGFYSNTTTLLGNLGNKIEELNATFYANNTLIEFQTFLLRGGDSINYSMAVNTAAFLRGNYRLSVRIDPLESETNITDNFLIGDWLCITVPGDVNGDMTVDIYDAILLAGHFNEHQPWIHPTIDSNVDINGDSSVDIYDAIILASHFNQHYP